MRWVVNPNGDSRETLQGELLEVYQAADALIDKIRDVTVNGRNYLGDTEALRADQDERLAQARKVEEVRRWAQNEIIKLEEGKR